MQISEIMSILFFGDAIPPRSGCEFAAADRRNKVLYKKSQHYYFSLLSSFGTMAGRAPAAPNAPYRDTVFGRSIDAEGI